MLHGGWANLLRLEHAQTTALHHRRTTHADIAGARGDDHIAAAQQRSIAGKAAPGDDPDHRHLTVEPGKAGKGGYVQARHNGHVHIARPPATALGKQHHRQPVLQRQTQHAVGLLVVAHALRAGQHGGVVGHGDYLVAVDLANASDHAVRRGVLDQVFFGSAAALRRHGERAVFDEAAGVTQVGDVLARAAQTLGMALGHGFGSAGVQRVCLTVPQALQVGAWGGSGNVFGHIALCCLGLRVFDIFRLQPPWNMRNTL